MSPSEDALGYLRKRSPPHVHVVRCNVGILYDRLLAVASDSSGLVVRFLRADKTSDVRLWVNEVSAALQFPPYFGDNWNALEECLTDLSWLPGEAYVLAVLGCDSVLQSRDSGELLEAFVVTVDRVAREWEKARGIGEKWAQAATPFHCLLHFETRDSAVQLSNKLTSLKVSHDLNVDFA